ncbi:heavy metal translocating P-type ATPase [Robbsia andropogonis]|uniref:heavy metal translocating P-type ATPase n=1 Tax=Robbsia andropogonis TaxID=28092 RepID=UPI002A6A2695|nr:heavy metal translocating P-type ATPase [Robbsia andropogonis]
MANSENISPNAPSASAPSLSASFEEGTFDVADMSCASCVRRLEKALQAIPGVADVAVNLASETAFVRYDPSQVQPTRIAEAGTAAGYPTQLQMADEWRQPAEAAPQMDSRSTQAVRRIAASPATLPVTDLPGSETHTLNGGAEVVSREGSELGTSDAKAARKARDVMQQRRNLILAIALTLPVFLFEMAGHLGLSAIPLLVSSVGTGTITTIEAVLTTLVLFGPGRQFFIKGTQAARRAAPDMNTLVALGAGAAWSFSMIAALRPDWVPEQARHLYFEAAAVIVVLILLGRYLEARAKGRTGDAIRALLALRPDTAHRLDGLDNGDDRRISDVPLAILKVGDAILIRPGERVPADAVLIDGASYVDESMLTGESMPVEKRHGVATDLTGGTVNGDGILRARVTRVGADATLSRIIALVQRAQGAKLPIQQKVDLVTAWFVPAVLVAAVLTFAAWMALGRDVAFALSTAVAVLIVACPCAMGLATPTSIMVAAGRAARLGVLFRQGDALQTLQACKVVAFDKTGTLTVGKPAVTDTHWFVSVDEVALWSGMAALERLSAHPLAHAVVAAATRHIGLAENASALSPHTVSNFVSSTGQGVAGTIDGHLIAIGNATWMAHQCVADRAAPAMPDDDVLQRVVAPWHAAMKTVLYVALSGRVVGALAVADPIRPETATVIAALRARQLRMAMITGDAAATAAAVASILGIDDVRADVTPDGKVAALDALRAQYGLLAFVGDGMNDAPALAHADVGIAIGSGSDVAIQSANVVLARSALHGVVDAVTISHATMRNIHQNLVWAFGYNVVLIPLAAGLAYPLLGLLLSPMLAAAAMALSSVFVLSNGLRLRFIRSALSFNADISHQWSHGERSV